MNIKSIRVDVSFIGEGNSKHAVRILDDLDDDVTIASVLKEIEVALFKYGEIIDKPGTSEY